MKLPAIATILCATALTACDHEPPRLILPPASLATCADLPDAPVLPARDGTAAVQLERDRLTLEGYLALRAAYADCKGKVEGLAVWVRENGG